MSSSAEAPHVLVCGGGIIGLSAAFFLVKRGCKVTIFEKTGVACAASGKSGGFLAADWAEHLGDLAPKSFELHEQVAAELDGETKYLYRKLNTWSVSIDCSGNTVPRKRPKQVAAIPSWIKQEKVAGISSIGTMENTAQVHPGLMCQTLAEYIKDHGGSIVLQGVCKLNMAAGVGGGAPSKNVRVASVTLDNGEIVSGDHVVLALGPWTPRALRDWCSGFLPFSVADSDVDVAYKAHSSVFQPTAGEQGEITGDALFVHFKDESGRMSEPEVYPRSNGLVYICGEGHNQKLPDSASGVESTPGAHERIHKFASSISGVLQRASVQSDQACFLPSSLDDVPMIGGVPGCENLFVGCGHTCWGILNSLGTGLGLSELIVDGQARSLDLSLFSLERFVERDGDL